MSLVNFDSIIKTLPLVLMSMICFFVNSNYAEAQSLSAQEISFLCAGSTTSVFRDNSASVNANRDGVIFKDQTGQLSIFIGNDLLGTVKGADYQAYKSCVVELFKAGQNSNATIPVLSTKLCVNPDFDSTDTDDRQCISKNDEFLNILFDKSGEVLRLDIQVEYHSFAEVCEDRDVEFFSENSDDISGWYIPLDAECSFGFRVELLDAKGILVGTGNDYRLYSIRGDFLVAQRGSAGSPNYSLVHQ